MQRAGFTLTDLVAVIVVIVMLLVVVTALLPSLHNERVPAHRVKCASNLRQIGLATILYSMDNDGQFPVLAFDPTKPMTAFTGWDAADSWVGPQPNDVTAAWYLTLKTQDITPDVYLCPVDEQASQPWDFGGKSKAETSNFGGPEHLGYSFQNPYSTHPDWTWNTKKNADFAIAADRNPGGPAVLDVTVDSTSQEMRAANSPNHGGDGQNVLYADGHVTFENTPFVGIRRDNIYATGELPDSGDPADRVDELNVGFTADKYDSLLLPAAAEFPRQATQPIASSNGFLLTVAIIAGSAAIIGLILVALSMRCSDAYRPAA